MGPRSIPAKFDSREFQLRRARWGHRAWAAVFEIFDHVSAVNFDGLERLRHREPKIRRRRIYLAIGAPESASQDRISR